MPSRARLILAEQDQTFLWVFQTVTPTPFLAAAGPGAGRATLRRSRFAGWQDPLLLAACSEHNDVLGGGCQRQVTPVAGPSLGISGLFSMHPHKLELWLASPQHRLLPSLGAWLQPAAFGSQEQSPAPSLAPRHH